MSPNGPESVRFAVPEGYAAVPLSAGAPSLAICILARKKPDPAGGHTVILRSTIDADVLLGCVTDSAGRVQRWVEIWIQSLEGLASGVPAAREALSNKVLDERWKRYADALARLDAQDTIVTGAQSEHPAPAFLDVGKLEIVRPADSKAGCGWELCQDDALLAAKGLPPYSTSLCRYLCLPALKDTSPFVPVTTNAPTNEATKPLAQVLGDAGSLVPVNPAGGLMLVRAWHPAGYEEFVNVLGGAPYAGLLHGRSPLELTDQEQVLKTDAAQALDQGRLLVAPQGRHGQLVETLHLKLRLLADAVGNVRSLIQSQQRPLLNLTAGSFRVSFAPIGAGLPVLWTARAVLVDAGDAVTLPIQSSDAQYFLRAAAAPATVYAPAAIGLSIRSQGVVRIRKVLPEASGATIIEGTLATQERIAPARNDLAWLRVRVSSGHVDLYARLESEPALAAGEWRFRTIGQRLSKQAAADLKAAEGVPMGNTPFEVVPLLTSPCDLYSLGVLAVRTLLVNPATTLAIALDEVLSLARQVAAAHKPDVHLPERIKAVFEQDKRWLESLGPHRLTQDELPPEEAFELVPSVLWFETLAMIVRMLPGIGPDSLCRDLGDAPGGAYHQVFDRTIADLDTLLLRTRSLVVVDWKANREIHAVIRKYLIGIS
ncbi:MAG: hypothetical protein ACE15C_03520 [Phycisphaerae bacterium]